MKKNISSPSSTNAIDCIKKIKGVFCLNTSEKIFHEFDL